ncbi:MAG: hypothetical protein ACI4J7_05565 [Ruminiclostridium sp.]
MADKVKNTAYKNSFNSEKYDRIGLMLKKGSKHHLQYVANEKRGSAKRYIKNAL